MEANARQFLVNGLPSDNVSALDRGLHYGDGVFETIAIRDGQPCYWQRHWDRLMDGCGRLGIPIPDEDDLQQDRDKLCNGVPQAVLKIIITRGTGAPGYGPETGQPATRITALFPWPDYPQQYVTRGIPVRFCEFRLGVNPALAGIKHLNRLEQVLASREFGDNEYIEGLMMDIQGNVVEGTRTNLFMVKENRLLTPDLTRCGVAGVMRAIVLELASELEVPSKISVIDRQQLLQADEIFVTNSLIGLWPVRQIEQHNYPIGPITRRLMGSLQHCPKQMT